ncbi:unnamed protein product [Caenorhabditis bovis]|uniref:Secreted protein n=1 Tax=Caenorhabditis bovis TaxID=2654633 RepID=A0A8S1F5K2_9PELO|nr:unnamed protein product [Caenorhabditis bovis]
MFKILSTLVFAAGYFGCALAAPVGPDFNNIQYAHNFSLTYQNGSLAGLDAIDSYPDVDSQMAQSLKEAINRALPGYLESHQPHSVQHDQEGSGVEMVSDHSVRARRQVEAPVDHAINENNNVVSSTQPYGTDEEFYARTDLIHFHVDIDVPEGSGDKPFPMPGFN